MNRNSRKRWTGIALPVMAVAAYAGVLWGVNASNSATEQPIHIVPGPDDFLAPAQPCEEPGSRSPSAKASYGAPLAPWRTETELACALAHREIAEQDGVNVAAFMKAEMGTVTDGNVGDRACMSGRLVRVLLVGDFPHIVTSGVVEPGQENRDFTVHGVALTADAKTGSVCERGVLTGKVSVTPGFVALPLTSK